MTWPKRVTQAEFITKALEVGAFQVGDEEQTRKLLELVQTGIDMVSTGYSDLQKMLENQIAWLEIKEELGNEAVDICYALRHYMDETEFLTQTSVYTRIQEFIKRYETTIGG